MSLFGVILVFFRISAQYGEIRSISSYLIQMRKIRTRITLNTDTFHAVSINPFLANLPILYPLKAPENTKSFQLFLGGRYKIGTLAKNGLKEFHSFGNVEKHVKLI